MSSLKTIKIVHMTGCPHCRIAVEELGRAAVILGVSCVLYDVMDDDEVKAADDMVKKYGDWSEDYIVPQVFFETKKGKILHVLTGYPEGTQFTRRAIKNLLGSEFFRRLAGTHVNTEPPHEVGDDAGECGCQNAGYCSRQHE